MSTRIDYKTASPLAFAAMQGLERHVRASGLEHTLLELVKLRASQINGCAYCIDMHWKDARAAGESEQRLYGLSAWHEAPYYSERERAALAWTERLTLVANAGVPDADYEELRGHFTDAEMMNLTMAIIAINGWNRIAIAFRPEVGVYQPAAATPC